MTPERFLSILLYVALIALAVLAAVWLADRAL